MADSDDDTLATFGTPLEPAEEDAPRKKAIPIHEQIVTDSEGRRRFHGAFTGGFSAGYFNTVGTKEGWQPSTFVSSRSKKAEQRAQKPEDYMDDDDLGDFGIAPRKIAPKEEFLSTQHELERNRHKHRAVVSESRESVIPGEPPLQDLVVPVRMSIGVQLLKKMGWTEGQGVGPKERRTKKKVYGCALPHRLQGQTSSNISNQEEEETEDVFAVGLLFAPKDVETLTFTPKDDKHGLGYKGLDPSTALISDRVWLGMEPVGTRAGRRGITGEAFGVGAFEEEDKDVYTTDHMSNYDIELSADPNTGLHGWTGPPKQNTRGGALSIFTAQPKAADCMKTFPPPVVPRNFNCTHKFEDFKTERSSDEVNHQTSKNVLTASDRGEMLGEEPLPAPKKSVFEYVSEQDKSRLLSTSNKQTFKPSSAASSNSDNSAGSLGCQTSRWSSLELGHSNFKPFAKDAAKQARYEEYLKSRQGRQGPYDRSNNSGLTEWEREREREEFSRAAALYRPLNTTMAARFTSAKLPDDHNTVYEEVPASQGSLQSEQTKAANMKMYGKLTRDKFEWHPDRILCKRFNIPDPYPGSNTVGVPRLRRPKFTLGNLIAPQSLLEIASPPSSAPDAGDNKSEELGPSSKVLGRSSDLSTVSEQKSKSSNSSSNEGTQAGNVIQPEAEEKKKEESQADSTVKRPAMDLFKAIFAESSSETSESDEDDEDKAGNGNSSLVVPETPSARESISEKIEESRFVESAKSNFETSESTVTKEEHRIVQTEAVEANRTVAVNDRSSSPDTFGPAPPPSFRKPQSSLATPKQGGLYFQSSETKDSKKRKHKRKDRKRNFSESSDSEDERHYNLKHKHKERKHKHRHKSKQKKEGNKSSGKERETEKHHDNKPEGNLPDNKQILDKLKNLQSLKAGRRMRAVDFM